MTDQPVILVCGLARCGTSLACQMLEAAGIDVAGMYPAFEPVETQWPVDAEWLAGRHGKATKLIMGDRPGFKLKPAPYRVIWLDRDPRQQAESQVKMVETLSPGLILGSRRKAVRAMASSLVRERKPALGILGAYTSDILEINFRNLIIPTSLATLQIAEFLQLPNLLESVEAMRDVIVPRMPECMPDMSIELELIAQREAAQ